MKIGRFLFYVVSLLLCLFLLNTYKDNGVIKNQETESVRTERNCIINALYYEARSEDKLGILSVASVIENRKNHVSYPTGYCNVVNQYKQFSYTLNDEPDVVKLSKNLTAYDKKAYEYIYRVADKMQSGTFETILPETVMWYATKKVSNSWTKSKKIYATIGAHHFYMKRTNNENTSKYGTDRHPQR